MKKKQTEAESIVSQFEQVCVGEGELQSTTSYSDDHVLRVDGQDKTRARGRERQDQEMKSKHDSEMAQKSSTISRLEKEVASFE